MVENKDYLIRFVKRNQFIKRGNGNDLGAHDNARMIGEVRDDLPPRVMWQVTQHVIYHLTHDNPKRSKLRNETMAFIVPGIKDPIGFVAAGIFRLKQPK